MTRMYRYPRLVVCLLWFIDHRFVSAASQDSDQQRSAATIRTKATEEAILLDDQLDCNMRRLMLKAAKRALPWRRDMFDVYEALELETRCSQQDLEETEYIVSNDSRRRLSRRTPHLRSTTPLPSDFTVHVCPESGDDSQVGSQKYPFASFGRALDATRQFVRYFQKQQRASTSNNSITVHSDSIPNRTIILHEGTHYLGSTVLLSSLDSNLTIRSAPNAEPWFSGGNLIKSTELQWKQSRRDKNIWMVNLSAINVDSVTGLFTLKDHQRMTLSRFPNANVEDWNHPNRYVPRNDVAEWIFPPFGAVPKFYSIDLTQADNPTGHIKNDSVMDEYNSYGTGQGGACATIWGDEPSYWCSNLAGGGWAEVDKAAALAGRMNIPRGMVLSNAASEIFQRSKKWKNPKGAIVHAAHTQGWSWHMFNISNVVHNKTSVTINFDKGGSQGGRNWQCKDADGRLSDCDGDDKMLDGGEWYIEGILEELDTPGEFYFDEETKLLYFYPMKNCETKSAEKTLGSESCIPDLVASNLQTMIKIQGTMDDPVQNIRIQGIGFRDAAKTYMEQWSAPSGGDWALHRGGAIHLEGTENVTIVDSTFRRLDGNAIMLGGYCFGTEVLRSEFHWLGNGAIATWGDTNGYNATVPSQPRHSVVSQNIMSNLGLYQKQSSAFGQNKACLNTVADNVMFNLPRAAINFNDGLGGGNLIRGNVIFNACRESGDHGPINSWDRMPFLVDTVRAGRPSFTPLPTHTTKNFILANYGASEGFDNDDGSSWYYTYANVFYAADGFKMDYGGHDSRFYGNLVYATNKHCFGTGSFLKDHADVFSNNTCIVVDTRNPSESKVGTLYQCSRDGMKMANNRYLTVSGNATWSCLPHSDTLTLQEMQNMGFEAGSSVAIIPDAASISSMAMGILDF